MSSKNVEFPLDWHISSTSNHWSNEKTMIDCITNIIIPYVTKTC